MFTVNRTALANELALLVQVGEKKTTMPATEYVMLGLVGNVLTLTATSIDVSLITEVEAEGEPWGGCVPCKQLYQLVKLLDAETITFKPTDGPLEVRAGRAKHKLPLMKSSEFPEIERAEPETVMLPAATFNEMLAAVTFAMMTNSDGPTNQMWATGISLIIKQGQLSLTATNISRLASVSCSVNSPLELNTIIPAQALSALAAIKDGEVGVGLTENLIYFTNKQRQLFVRRLHSDRFPDWQAMFPQSYQHEAIVGASELGTAIKRAMLTQSVSEKRLVTLGLRWTWANGEVLIETKANDKGKSDEVVVAECPSLNGSSVALGVDGQLVLDALSRLGERLRFRFSPNVNSVQLVPAEPTTSFVYYVGTVTLRHWG